MTVKERIQIAIDQVPEENLRALEDLIRDFVAENAQEQPPAPSESHAEPERKPFWERILERTAEVPEEEWAKVPIDGAEQHNHYIYGVPKRPVSRSRSSPIRCIGSRLLAFEQFFPGGTISLFTPRI